jgi:hypothetical protein
MLKIFSEIFKLGLKRLILFSNDLIFNQFFKNNKNFTKMLHFSIVFLLQTSNFTCPDTNPLSRAILRHPHFIKICIGNLKIAIF